MPAGPKRASIVQLKGCPRSQGLDLTHWWTVSKSLLSSKPTWPSRTLTVLASLSLSPQRARYFLVPHLSPPPQKGSLPSTCSHSPLCCFAFMEHLLSARQHPAPTCVHHGFIQSSQQP